MFKHCNAGLSRKGIWLKFLFYRKGTGIKQLNSSFYGKGTGMEFSNGKGKEWEFEYDIHGNGGKRERELYKKNNRFKISFNQTIPFT